MDIEYSLTFQLTKASRVTIEKYRDGRVMINSNYLNDEQLQIIYKTFNEIITLHKIKHKEWVEK